jgi:hypothetical protein
MLHASLDLMSDIQQSHVIDSVAVSHKDLLHQFTGHLLLEDHLYYNKWINLLDLEAAADRFQISETWLRKPTEREELTSKTISALIFDESKSSHDAHFDEFWYSIITLMRSPVSRLQTPISNLGFENGNLVVISSDSSTGNDMFNGNADSRQKQTMRKMHLVRGKVHLVTEKSIQILASKEDHARIRRTSRFNGMKETVRFRVDKDETAFGIGTLRQNLVNLCTGDKRELMDSSSTLQHAVKHRCAWLRDLVVRFRCPVFDKEMIRKIFDCPSPGNLSTRYMYNLKTEFAKLNPNQRSAVVKVRTTIDQNYILLHSQCHQTCCVQAFIAKDFSIIQGMPGTGKISNE